MKRGHWIGFGCAKNCDVAGEQQIAAFEISELDHDAFLGGLRFSAFQINFFTAFDRTALKQEG
jgi:hypothetical protein